MGLFTYRRLPVSLVRVDDQIQSADGSSWLPPVTFVDHRPPCWTRVWWTTRPTKGMVSAPDWERPNDTKVRIRRPRPNHDVTRDQIAAEFARHGCKVRSVGSTDLRITKSAGGVRHRSALLYFYADAGTFSGAHIGSAYIRSIDVIRRHFNVPTYH